MKLKSWLWLADGKLNAEEVHLAIGDSAKLTIDDIANSAAEL